MEQRSALFVCLGNICRSPIAEAVFRRIVNDRGVSKEWIIDSAAVIDYHLGKGPDKRTTDVLKRHGITDYHHIVRQVSTEDFRKFQFIFGMDEDNMCDLKGLKKLAGSDTVAKLHLLGSFDPEGILIIQDPYYGSDNRDFDKVVEQCERSCKGFLDSVYAGFK